MSIEIGLLIVLLALFFGVMLWAARREASDFNHGICTNCHTPLRHFDNDSQGGRGYTCDACGRAVWVSYPWVDRLVRQRA